MHFNRYITIDNNMENSFFMWGPRQAGKTYFLKKHFKGAYYIDLLDNSEFIKYTNNPSHLREVVNTLPEKQIIIIDEVQKIPALLDEVHKLIEDKNRHFGLCGSSARKLKRNQANLLGGRALRYELFGFTSFELKGFYDLVKACNRGNIANHYLSENYWDYLESYVSDYLKEEIYAESLVRNLPSFSDFLRASAICDTETVDYTNIASDCGVKSPTVKSYYEIMVDTLQGFFLPSYARKPKRKVIHSPKFYYANVGVVNWLAKRRLLEPGSTEFGKAFENVIINEIRAWNIYSGYKYDLAYWKLASGEEVDLVIEEIGLAIEIKSSKKITTKHIKGLRELQKDQKKFHRRVIVSLESTNRITDDGIQIYSYQSFLKDLWEHKFSN